MPLTMSQPIFPQNGTVFSQKEHFASVKKAARIAKAKIFGYRFSKYFIVILILVGLIGVGSFSAYAGYQRHSSKGYHTSINKRVKAHAGNYNTFGGHSNSHARVSNNNSVSISSGGGNRGYHYGQIKNGNNGKHNGQLKHKKVVRKKVVHKKYVDSSYNDSSYNDNSYHDNSYNDYSYSDSSYNDSSYSDTSSTYNTYKYKKSYDSCSYNTCSYHDSCSYNDCTHSYDSAYNTNKNYNYNENSNYNTYSGGYDDSSYKSDW
jgi:hypothetical protein